MWSGRWRRSAPAAPVVVRGSEVRARLSAEALDETNAALLAPLAGTGARLVLPAPRLRRLGVPERTEPGAVALPLLDPARIETLALRLDGRIDAPVAPASPGDEAALALMALAQVLPAVLAIPGERGASRHPLGRGRGGGPLTGRQAAGLREVSRAPVPLASAPDSSSWSSAAGEGLRDQVAVVIGKPDLSEPVVRCGCTRPASPRDLFGSLKMRLRRPAARHRRLDGAARRRHRALSRSGGPRERARQQDPRLRPPGPAGSTPTRPTRPSASASTSAGSTSPRRC